MPGTPISQNLSAQISGMSGELSVQSSPTNSRFDSDVAPRREFKVQEEFEGGTIRNHPRLLCRIKELIPVVDEGHQCLEDAYVFSIYCIPKSTLNSPIVVTWFSPSKTYLCQCMNRFRTSRIAIATQREH